MRGDKGGQAAESYRDFCSAVDRTEIKIIRSKRFDGKSGNWDLTRHMHDFVEIIYFLNGDVEISTAESHSGAGDYDVIIYPRGMYHSEKLQGRGHHDIFCIWADLGATPLSGMIWIQDDRSLPIKWLLEHLHAEIEAGATEPALIQYYSKAALTLIARKAFSRDASSCQTGVRPFERVIRYMHDHIAEPLTVDILAEVVSVSPSYLSRMFRRYIGLPPGEYLRNIRMDAAKSMLAFGEKNIGEISDETGFTSPKYFAHAFRKETGMTPSQWKRQEGRSGGPG